MTLKDLLRKCRNGDLLLNVTALAYFKEDKSYYSFRTLCNTYCEEVQVKDYTKQFSEEELALEVKAWAIDDNILWIDVVEWITFSKEES